MSVADDLYESLENASYDQAAPVTDEGREAFRVDGLETAAWCMRKLARVHAQRAEISRVAQAEIDRVEDWASVQDSRWARDAAYFEGLLGRYALEVRAADPRQKSVSTPHGTVRTREVGGGWTVTEDAVDWAEKEHPEWVRSVRSLAVVEARKGLTVTESGVVDAVSGQLVPGITVAPKVMKASVELAPGVES